MSDRIEDLLERITNQLDTIEEYFMAEIDDLNAAVSALTNQETKNATDIGNALAALAAAVPPSLKSATTAIQAAVNQLVLSDQSVETALTPPAPPAPPA